ncbi:protein kinase domain-containing protein [Caerostris darwini]|uniref:Protein kinase domain-containing protein n=1 Tax=Caerostris darwini TaxID=1538125 RepID=A0AAV4V5W1_9ARAC|nr:protein kinase domain-containing protein [Caerostris darwini]
MEGDENSEKNEKAVKKRRRSEDVRLTIEILETEKEYRNIKVLGKGTYGDVYMMFDPERESDIAVKIVTSENIAETELAMWPKLHHPNIVPLLELMTLRPLDVVIFIMPVQRKTLHDMMYDLGLPYIYRPPEACQTLGSDIVIDGRAYDMWGFGIMTLEIFTHFVLASNINDCNHWIKEVYPTLFNVLQEKEFTSLMTQTLPGYNMSSTQAKLALNFVYSFLMVEPLERALPTEGLQHQFLNRGISLGPIADSIWIHKSMLITVNNEKSCNQFEGNIDASQQRQEKSESNLSTDDEYLTASDSDGSRKKLNSINQDTISLSAKSHVSNCSSQKDEPDLIKLVESNERLDVNSESTFNKCTTAASHADMERNVSQCMEGLKIHAVSSGQNLNRNFLEETLINQTNLKILPKVLKKQCVVRNKSKIYHEPMRTKTMYLRCLTYNKRPDERHVKHLPSSALLLKKIHERKYPNIVYDGRNILYPTYRTNTQFPNAPNFVCIPTANTVPHYPSSSTRTSSRMFHDRIYDFQRNSKPNEVREEMKINSSKKEDVSVETSVKSKENDSSDHKLVESQKENEELKKQIAGDAFPAEFGDFVYLDDINAPSTSSEGLRHSKTESTGSVSDTTEKSSNSSNNSKIMISVNKTLGQLNQINDILQKVLICEKCSSERKVEKDDTDNSECITLTETGSEDFTPDFQTYAEELVNIKHDNENASTDSTEDMGNIEQVDSGFKICKHDIISCANNLPSDILSGQNVNLIINCPRLKREFLNLQSSCDSKKDKSPESKFLY